MAYAGTIPVHTGGYSQAYDKSFDDIFMDEYTRNIGQYTRVANVSTWEEHTIKKGEWATMGSHEELDQGAAVSFDTLVQGPEKEVEFTGYALGAQTTRTSIRDDRHGKLSAIPAELGKSASYSVDVLFWDILNSGFTTGRTGFDSAALFASHTRIDGGTHSNLGSAAALSETTLEAMILYFRKIVNQKGIYIEMAPNLLIIPPDLEMLAKRLLLSEYRPGTANNDINTLKMENLQYMVVPWLTSTTAYFALAADHDLDLVWRDPVEYEEGGDFRTKTKLYSSTFRLAVCFWDYRGTWGNAGA